MTMVDLGGLERLTRPERPATSDPRLTSPETALWSCRGFLRDVFIFNCSNSNENENLQINVNVKRLKSEDSFTFPSRRIVVQSVVVRRDCKNASFCQNTRRGSLRKFGLSESQMSGRNFCRGTKQSRVAPAFGFATLSCPNLGSGYLTDPEVQSDFLILPEGNFRVTHPLPDPDDLPDRAWRREKFTARFYSPKSSAFQHFHCRRQRSCGAAKCAKAPPHPTMSSVGSILEA